MSFVLGAILITVVAAVMLIVAVCYLDRRHIKRMKAEAPPLTGIKTTLGDGSSVIVSVGTVYDTAATLLGRTGGNDDVASLNGDEHLYVFHTSVECIGSVAFLLSIRVLLSVFAIANVVHIIATTTTSLHHCTQPQCCHQQAKTHTLS